MQPEISSFVPTLISLAVILGVLFAVGLVLRRLRDGSWSRPGAGAARIRILAARPVGWQSSLLIVEADGQRFLVGAGRNGLTAIGALSAQDGDFSAALDAAAKNPPRVS